MSNVLLIALELTMLAVGTVVLMDGLFAQSWQRSTCGRWMRRLSVAIRSSSMPVDRGYARGHSAKAPSTFLPLPGQAVVGGHVCWASGAIAPDRPQGR